MPRGSQPRQRQTIDGFVAPRATRRLVVAPAARLPVSPVQSPVVTAESVKKPAPSRSLPKIDLQLEDEAPKSGAKRRPSAARTFRKWALRGGLAMFLLLFAVGGILFAQGYIKLHKVFKGGASHAAALQSDVSPTLLKGEGDGRVNILLLGNGGDGHDGPDLTDTIMVASIDPVNKTAALLSVPRDLWVKMPNRFMGAYQKINAAYEAGKYQYLGKINASNSNAKAIDAGFKAADQVVGQILGIPIHYNMVINFSAFKQAVDTVGGVTVNVPEQLYDPTMAWENAWNPVLAKAGVQQMNGKQALLYVRSRETSSDFARGQRQRLVILALKEKILSLGTLSNPLKISQLMSAFGDNMITDFSLSDAVRMYNLAKGIANANVQSLDLVTAPNNFVTTGNLNGTSIDQPIAGLYDYAAIQGYVRSTLKDGYITKENAQITVLNGTSQEGLATIKANELKAYGYNVTKVDNAPTQGYAKTVIVDLTNGVDKYTKHYLENRYGVSAVSKLPDGSTIQPGTANFIIILGQDQI